MELFILRHASTQELVTSDSLRQLTDEGRQEADRVAHFCEEHDLRPELILTSPLIRAEQTARPVAQRLGVELVVAPFLAGGASVAAMLDGLESYRRFGRLMIVGHEPDLSALAGKLIGVEGGLGVRVRKASLLGLRMEAPRIGAATLDFLIPVALM